MYLLVFNWNLLVHLAEKILLMQPLTFGGDYQAAIVESMKLQHLRYFVAVLDAGSLSRAARSLHMAQPTLSQHIQALEHSMGVQLLNRIPSGVSATAAGTILAEHAVQILESLERARKDVISTAEDVRGEVSITMPRMVSADLSPEILRRAVRDYPKVILRIREGNSLFCTELVENARVDLGILPVGYNKSTTNAIPLLAEKLYLVGSVQNDLGISASDAPITFAEATTYPLTLIKKPHSLREEIDQLASEQGVALNVVFESDSGGINRYYVSAGVAFTILPLHSFREKMMNKQVFARELISPPMVRNYHLCWNVARPLNQATKAISDLIQTVVEHRNAANTSA